MDQEFSRLMQDIKTTNECFKRNDFAGVVAGHEKMFANSFICPTILSILILHEKIDENFEDKVLETWQTSSGQQVEFRTRNFVCATFIAITRVDNFFNKITYDNVVKFYKVFSEAVKLDDFDAASSTFYFPSFVRVAKAQVQSAKQNGMNIFDMKKLMRK